MNKKILFLILLISVLVLPLAASAYTNDANTIANNVKELTVQIGVAIVVIGWVITGILYLTAGGAPDKLGTAKKALIACVIGTVVVVIAEAGYAVIAGIVDPLLS